MTQVRTDNSNLALIKVGRYLGTQLGILFTDAGRTTDLLTNTLLAKIAATGKVVPYTDVAATDGTAIPYGIYVGEDIPFADIVAGDVEDLPIALLGDAASFDSDLLVLENSVTLADVIGTGVTLTTVGDELRKIGFIPEVTVLITEQENV